MIGSVLVVDNGGGRACGPSERAWFGSEIASYTIRPVVTLERRAR